MGGKVGAMIPLLLEREIGRTILSLTMLDISPVEYKPEELESIKECIDTLVVITEKYMSGGAYLAVQEKEELNDVINSYFPSSSLAKFLQSSIVETAGTTSVRSSEYSHPTKFQWTFQLFEIQNHLKDLLQFPCDNIITSQDESRQMREVLPVFLLKGGKSKFVKSLHLNTISTLFPQYSVASIQDASHWLHFEKPDETSEEIIKFLRKVNHYYNHLTLF
jgi:pimeloyl-ACP methyl ester carboxylesterase